MCSLQLRGMHIAFLAALFLLVIAAVVLVVVLSVTGHGDTPTTANGQASMISFSLRFLFSLFPVTP